MPPTAQLAGKWHLPGAQLSALSGCVALLISIPPLALAAAPPTGPATGTASELVARRNLCSHAAQQAYAVHWSHPAAGITLLGFTNHYDVQHDRCYLLVTYRRDKLTWFDASDVQTGKVAAHIKLSSP